MSVAWTGEAARLAARIEAYIDGSLAGAAPEPFDRLALDIHRFQRDNDPTIAALTEGTPRTWRAIPAVPTSLFQQLDVGTARGADAHVVFRTSGTTTGRRGAHAMRSTELYDRGSVAWFRRCVPDAPPDIAALLEDPAQAPDSSLSHMVALFGDASWHVESGALARGSLDTRVRSASSALFVATSAFALAEWLDGDVPMLPPDSVLMVTGGFKGRRTQLSEADLFREARWRLRPARVITEYGMTELSSQLWGTPDAPYRAPHWLRVVAVDPATGEPLPPGARGQLRFVDLCNVDSTVAIETMDDGIVHDDGAVTLFGRLAGAPPRGCSLTVDDALLGRS